MEDVKVLENFSYEDYLDIDKSTQERVELIFGKIYMMAGTSALHQDTVLSFALKLKLLAKEKNKCLPRVAPFDLKLEVDGKINVVQPDLMLFCKDEKPCAIFEVLSSSTALKDKSVKKELYEKSAILEYFLVNAEYKLVEKFELIDGEYKYVGAFGEEHRLEIKCLNAEIELNEVFEF